MGQNRSMEAKRIKYLKQSKARPRTLRMNNGHMKGQSSVDRSKIPEEWLPLFDYRNRAIQSADQDYLEALFPSANQVSAGRERSWKLSQKPEADTILKTVLKDGKFQKCVMFSDTRMTCFYFVEYHTIAKVVRESITYNNRERAIGHYEDGSIRWKESFTIPSVE